MEMKNKNIDRRTDVSIIIPIYNVEAYIGKCIDSVVNQTRKEIEIICVNDGTSDNSMQIVQEKADKDSRIQIINIKNSGLSVARNVGMEKATGKYIIFLDSDDYLALDTIEKLVEHSEKNDTDILFFGAEAIFENEQVAQKQSGYAGYYNRNAEYRQIYTGEDLFVQMMKSHDFKPSACLMLIKKTFIDEVCVKFYPGILHEDNLFTVQLLHQAKRAAVLDKPFYKRIVRDGSITSGEKSVRRAYGLFVCHKEILKYLSLQGCSDNFLMAVMNYLSTVRKIATGNIANMEMDSILEEIKKVSPEETVPFLDYVYCGKTTNTMQSGYRLSRWLNRINNVYIYLRKNGVKSTCNIVTFRLKQLALSRNREGENRDGN